MSTPVLPQHASNTTSTLLPLPTQRHRSPLALERLHDGPLPSVHVANGGLPLDDLQLLPPRLLQRLDRDRVGLVARLFEAEPAAPQAVGPEVVVLELLATLQQGAVEPQGHICSELAIARKKKAKQPPKATGNESPLCPPSPPDQETVPESESQQTARGSRERRPAGRRAGHGGPHTRADEELGA